MILFNLFFSPNTLESTKFFKTSFYQTSQSSRLNKDIRQTGKLAYVIKKMDFLYESKEDLARKNFIKPNIWQNFLHTIWEQKIFLSIPNKVSDKYVIELNYLNIRKNQNFHRYLVSKFSKSLFDGSINSSINNYNIVSQNTNSNIFYLWNKDFKLKKIYFFNLLKKDPLEQYIKKIRSNINNKLNFNHLPIFTISNNLGQMIISELPEKFNSQHKMINISANNNSSLYSHYGWFFINHEDAQEYMEYVRQLYSLDQDTLKIFTCNINTLYTIMSKFNQKIQFKIIPDLLEINNLVKYYRYHKHISFHDKQQYTKSSFKGQPIYLFKLANDHVYSYLDNNNVNNTYNLAFTNYDTAVQSWNKLNNQLLDKQRFSKPYLYVYNLEDFIISNLNHSGDKLPILLVPSQKVYSFTKQNQLRKNMDLLYDTLFKYSSVVELWSKRIWWSLTSRQP